MVNQTPRETAILNYLNKITDFMKEVITHKSKVKIKYIIQDEDSDYKMAGLRTNDIETYVIEIPRTKLNILTPKDYENIMMHLISLSVDYTVDILTGKFKHKYPSLHNNKAYRTYLFIKLLRMIPTHPTFESIYFNKEE